MKAQRNIANSNVESNTEVLNEVQRRKPSGDQHLPPSYCILRVKVKQSHQLAPLGTCTAAKQSKAGGEALPESQRLEKERKKATECLRDGRWTYRASDGVSSIK